MRQIELIQKKRIMPNQISKVNKKELGVLVISERND